MIKFKLTLLTTLSLFLMMTPNDMEWEDSLPTPAFLTSKRKRRREVAQCKKCNFVATNEVSRILTYLRLVLSGRIILCKIIGIYLRWWWIQFIFHFFFLEIVKKTRSTQIASIKLFPLRLDILNTVARKDMKKNITLDLKES